MKKPQLIKHFIFFIFLSCFFTRQALAYVGPGVGLSAIGAFLAVLLGAIATIFGFVWYPIRRFIRMRKKPDNNVQGGKVE